MLKMNTLLAKVEHGAAQFNRMVGNYFAFFKNKQGMFEGIKKTFKPREGYQEDARYMGTTKVATTVDEKLQWLDTQGINKELKHKSIGRVSHIQGLSLRIFKLVLEGLA